MSHGHIFKFYLYTNVFFKCNSNLSVTFFVRFFNEYTKKNI